MTDETAHSCAIDLLQGHLRDVGVVAGVDRVLHCSRSDKVLVLRQLAMPLISSGCTY